MDYYIRQKHMHLCFLKTKISHDLQVASRTLVHNHSPILRLCMAFPSQHLLPTPSCSSNFTFSGSLDEAMLPRPTPGSR